MDGIGGFGCGFGGEFGSEAEWTLFGGMTRS